MISNQEYDTLVLMLHSKTDHDLAIDLIKRLTETGELIGGYGHKLALEYGKIQGWGKDTLNALQLNIWDMQVREVKEKLKQIINET